VLVATPGLPGVGWTTGRFVERLRVRLSQMGLPAEEGQAG
jgi:hypothetical protein